MAQMVNTIDFYDFDSTFPDIQDTVYNVTPEDTPLQSLMSKGKSTNILKQWDVYHNRNAATNAAIDGDEFGADSRTVPDRRANYHQISRIDLSVTGRAEVADRPGGKRAMAEQIMNASLDLRRDMETSLCTRQVGALGAGDSAGTTAGFPAWVTSNLSRGTSGTAPGLSTAGIPNSLGTVGAARPLSKSQIDSVLLSCYQNSGPQPSIIMFNPVMKQKFDLFALTPGKTSGTIPEARQDFGGMVKGMQVLLGNMDVYKGSFGMYTLVPNRYMPSGNSASEVFIINPEYLEVSFYRPFQRASQGRRGDSMENIILADYALCVKNERTQGVIADLNQSSNIGN